MAAVRIVRANYSSLKPVQPALLDAPIRMSIYKKAGAKGLLSGDPNKSSRSLRKFFNEIKRPSASEPDRLDDYIALGGESQARGDNPVLVLSRSEGSEIVFLEGDHRLQAYAKHCQTY